MEEKIVSAERRKAERDHLPAFRVTASIRWGPNLLAEKLHQVIAGFLRVHDQELRHDALLHLRILLGARELHERGAVALEEESIDDGPPHVGVAVGLVDRDEDRPRLRTAEQSEVLDGND